MTLTRFGIKILKQGYNILPVYIVTKNFRKKTLNLKPISVKSNPQEALKVHIVPKGLQKGL